MESHAEFDDEGEQEEDNTLIKANLQEVSNIQGYQPVADVHGQGG